MKVRTRAEEHFSYFSFDVQPFFLMVHACNALYVLHTYIQSCMEVKKIESKKKKTLPPTGFERAQICSSNFIGTFSHIADWLKRQSKMGLNCVITYIYGSLVSILTIPQRPHLKDGSHSIVKILTNDPEKWVIEFISLFQQVESMKSPII